MTNKIVKKQVEGRTRKYFIHAEEKPNRTVTITLDIHCHTSISYTFGAESFSNFIHKKHLPKCVKNALRDVLMEFNQYRLEMVYVNI